MKHDNSLTKAPSGGSVSRSLSWFNWSLLGNVSVGLACLHFFLIFAYMIIVGVVVFVAIDTHTKPTDPASLHFALALMIPAMFGMFMIVLSSVVGMIFGIIGLFQRQQHTIGALTGILLNAVIIVLVVCTVGGGLGGR